MQLITDNTALFPSSSLVDRANEISQCNNAWRRPLLGFKNLIRTGEELLLDWILITVSRRKIKTFVLNVNKIKATLVIILVVIYELN